jgi:S1-C subfamily serine protease
VAALLVAWAAGSVPASAKGSLSRVEHEFERAIRRVTPATVVCLPWQVDPKLVIGGSSGVIMSRKGLVLSDGDAGVHLDQMPTKASKPKLVWSDEIEVRLPNLKGKGFRSLRARVLHRDRDHDTTLLRIEDPPSTLKSLDAASSDDLRVGDFAFAMGNSFGLAAEATPTLTAGVVTALPRNPDATGGKWQYIYTSAAVNQGVNGGPLVDINGNLIGTISSAVSLVQRDVKPDDPRLAYAYFGKVVPVDRLRTIYAALPEAKELFSAADEKETRDGESGALATVFHETARRAYASLVSLDIERKTPLNLTDFTRGRPVQIPRYLGPVSGVLVSPDGYVLTSLYNLANVSELVVPAIASRMPENARIEAGIAGVQKIVAHLPDGRAVPARVVARHEGIGLALLKADVGKGAAPLVAATPAPPEAFKAGRFVLALGDPFGKDRADDPLLTIGMLSKQHDLTSDGPWAGQWQTDAGVTDANSGGAAVDLRGRLLGVLTIWSSRMHGRNSGIGFIVPWRQIQRYLAAMERGRNFEAPFMGVSWKAVGEGLYSTTLDTVMEGSAAAKAGLRPGDEIVAMDGKPVQKPEDVKVILHEHWAGDTLELTIRRGGNEQKVSLTLGAR